MKRIYLIGFMGSGKSTLGPLLAKELNYTFLELDRWVELEAGLSIPQIFSEFSESHFRSLESDVLAQTQVLQNVVIATGGGTPASADNMEWMKTNGTVVYLKVPAQVLTARLSDQRSCRPLLRNVTDAELQPEITRLLSIREPFYSRAHYVLDNPDASVLTEFISSFGLS